LRSGRSCRRQRHLVLAPRRPGRGRRRPPEARPQLVGHDLDGGAGAAVQVRCWSRPGRRTGGPQFTQRSVEGAARPTGSVPLGAAEGALGRRHAEAADGGEEPLAGAAAGLPHAAGLQVGVGEPRVHDDAGGRQLGRAEPPVRSRARWRLASLDCPSARQRVVVPDEGELSGSRGRPAWWPVLVTETTRAPARGGREPHGHRPTKNASDTGGVAWG
jgi:hypothetical protein